MSNNTRKLFRFFSKSATPPKEDNTPAPPISTHTKCNISLVIKQKVGDTYIQSDNLYVSTTTREAAFGHAKELYKLLIAIEKQINSGVKAIHVQHQIIPVDTIFSITLEVRGAWEEDILKEWYYGCTLESGDNNTITDSKST